MAIEHFEDIPLFMPPKVLSEVTGEHEASIRRGIKEHRIPADLVNGRWRICRDLVFPNTKKGVEQNAKREAEHGGD